MHKRGEATIPISKLMLSIDPTFVPGEIPRFPGGKTHKIGHIFMCNINAF